MTQPDDYEDNLDRNIKSIADSLLNIEKNIKYIASYQKFQMKEDLSEVLKPLVQSISKVSESVLRGRDGS